jgi:hypothetical protein
VVLVLLFFVLADDGLLAHQQEAFTAALFDGQCVFRCGSRVGESSLILGPWLSWIACNMFAGAGVALRLPTFSECEHNRIDVVLHTWIDSKQRLRKERMVQARFRCRNCDLHLLFIFLSATDTPGLRSLVDCDAIQNVSYECFKILYVLLVCKLDFAVVGFGDTFGCACWCDRFDHNLIYNGS